jgi:hypothetical protein
LLRRIAWWRVDLKKVKLDPVREIVYVSPTEPSLATNPSYRAREWRKLLNVLGAPNEGSVPGPAGSAASIPELQAPSAPKYYLYISDSKVNMLYAQSRPVDLAEKLTTRIPFTN